MAQDVVVKIKAEDDFSAIIKKINSNFNATSKKIESGSKKMDQSLGGVKNSAALLKGGIVALTGIVTGKLVGAFARAGSEMEDLTVQFQTLLGSTNNAKARMQELAKFAQTTPFQLKGVADASKVLETLTSGTLSTGDGLRMVGDAAATAGVDFKELAVTIGRAYSGLQSNRAIGESSSRLQELGLISGDTRNEIEKLQAAGKGKEAWVVLQAELKKTEGGMKLLSGTVSGLTSTIKDQLGAAMRQLLDGGIWDGTKNGLQSIVDIMNDMLDSGIIFKIGFGISNAFKLAFLTVKNGLDGIVGAYLFAQSKIVGVAAKFAKFLKLEEISAGLNNMSLTLGAASEEAAIATEKNFERAGQAYKNLTDLFSGKIQQPKFEEEKRKKKESLLEEGAGGTKTDYATLAYEESLKIADIRREFEDLSRTDREKELADLDEWYEEKFMSIGYNEENILLLTETYRGKESEINQKYREKEKAEELKKFQFEQALKRQRFSELKKGVDNMRGILEYAGKENEKAAKAARAVAIVETSINTAQMAVKSYNALASIPTIGPVLGFAAAAAAIGYGMTQVASIKSQKFAGGGIVQGNSTVGDQQMISANAGEMVFNRGQQSELYNLLNSNNPKSRSSNTNINVTINGNASEDNIQQMVRELKKAQQEMEYLGV